MILENGELFGWNLTGRDGKCWHSLVVNGVWENEFTNVDVKREKKDKRQSEGERNTETNTETGAETERDKFMNNYTVCTRKDAHIFTPAKRKEKKKRWW